MEFFCAIILDKINQGGLSMNSQAQLTTIKTFAKSKLAADKTGHNFDHIQRVVKLANRLAKAQTKPVDLTVILAAAYLHDTIDDKLVASPMQAVNEVKELLTSLAFSSAQSDEIIHIITHMSYASNLSAKQTLSLEGQIVQDADWLDAIGAIGITRAIYYGGAHGEKIYDPEILPRTQLDKASYRNLADETIINHFYEKLFKLADMLNTPQARALAASRQQVMKDFVATFKAEWDAEA